VVGPRQIIDPPTFTAARYGLLSVVDRQTSSGSHWQNGVTWSAYCTDDMGASTYDECIAVTGAPDNGVPEPTVKSTNVDHVLHGATPFTPYVRFDCSPVGNEEAVRIATEALGRTEEWQVEYAFWTGLVDGKSLAFPHLAATVEVLDADGVVLQDVASPVATGAALDVVTGLGLLEEGLANCYGGRGVIHVPVRLLPTLIRHDLVEPVGGRSPNSGQFGQRLETAAGNLVAVGAGYPGTGPDGTNPGPTAAWMYATGPVFMRRSDVKVTPFASAVNRDINMIEMIAERTYVLGFDCCLLAVQVELGASA